jgi:hypothetical protein
MSPAPEIHLSAEQIDAWLAGSPDNATQDHLHHCASCLEQLRVEKEIADQIAALPLLSPSADFADRVMASVRVRDPFAIRSLQETRHRVLASRRSRAMAASLALLILGSMVGSVAWSLGHQATLTALGSWILSQGGQALWLGVRGLASNIIEQPWYAWVRAALGTPGRLALISALVSLAYLGGLLTLRRLLALPTQRVAHAGI